MKINNYNSLICLLLLFHLFSKAQFYNLPPDYFAALLTEKQLSEKDNTIHTGIKPYIHFYSKKYQYIVDSHNVYKYIKEDQGVDAVFYNHLINIDPKEEAIHIRIDPIVNFEKGRDFSDSIDRKPFTNTRGIIASGEIGKQVYFETMVVENQSVFMNYMNNSLLNSKVVPGQGRYKIFKQTGYDYAFASGFVSIQASKQTNIQLGHGKQKIGHGYRSLLLSDNSFNYPYLRLTQQWFKNKIQYSAIYASLTNFAPAAKNKPMV